MIYIYRSLIARGGFDWDAANVEHIYRHGVLPADPEQALTNDPITIGYNAAGGGEKRWVSVGPTGKGRVLTVVWTERGGLVRVVTAYRAPKRLRVAYENAKGSSSGSRKADPAVQD